MILPSRKCGKGWIMGNWTGAYLRTSQRLHCVVYWGLCGESHHVQCFPNYIASEHFLEHLSGPGFKETLMGKMLTQRGPLSFCRGLALERIPDTANSPRPWLLPHTYLPPPLPNLTLSTK